MIGSCYKVTSCRYEHRDDGFTMKSLLLKTIYLRVFHVHTTNYARRWEIKEEWHSQGKERFRNLMI